MTYRRLLHHCFFIPCLIFSVHAETSATLCRAEERPVFNCRLDGKKDMLVSLCASKDITMKKGSLQYRSGAGPHKIELSFPKDPTHFVDVFNYGRVTSPGQTLQQVTFKNEGVEYTIFDYDSMDDGKLVLSHGVRVKKVDGKKAVLSCKSRPSPGLSLNFEDFLKKEDDKDLEW